MARRERVSLTPVRVPCPEPGLHSPDERELTLAGARGVGRAVFAATRGEPDFSGQPPDERLDPGDVIASGVRRIGVETLILGDELREFGLEELEERLACPATEEQHVRLRDLRAGFARPNQERTQIRLAVRQVREYRHDEQARGDPPG